MLSEKTWLICKTVLRGSAQINRINIRGFKAITLCHVHIIFTEVTCFYLRTVWFYYITCVGGLWPTVTIWTEVLADLYIKQPFLLTFFNTNHPTNNMQWTFHNETN